MTKPYYGHVLDGPHKGQFHEDMASYFYVNIPMEGKLPPLLSPNDASISLGNIAVTYKTYTYDLTPAGWKVRK